MPSWSMTLALWTLALSTKPFCIHQEVSLAAAHLLASVVSSLLSANPGCRNPLGVHYARTGLRIPSQADSQAFVDGPIDPLPGAVDAPFSKVKIGRVSCRERV